MKYMSTITALTLVAMLAILPGCSETAPPEELKVVKSEAAPAKEEAAPVDAAPAVEAVPAEEMPKEEAPAATPAPEVTPAPEAAPAVAGPVTYVIEPNDDSTLSFTGYKITGNQQGSWGDFSGSVVVTDGNIETSQITINFDMTSLFTTASMLTENLQTVNWFNTKEFPGATFTSKSVTKTDEGYDVAGELLVRGVTSNITFPATIEIDGDTLKTTADFALLRSDWGMTDTGWGNDLVKDEVRITFDLVANKG
tara:strand:+ start:989 stop:1747 length:759 start_codon:yes stop_codon:yes gene_type:complete